MSNKMISLVKMVTSYINDSHYQYITGKIMQYISEHFKAAHTLYINSL